jgi:hypothetical protein
MAATFAGASDTRLSPANDSLGIPIFLVELLVMFLNAFAAGVKMISEHYYHMVTRDRYNWTSIGIS